jgi:hypothetical protein
MYPSQHFIFGLIFSAILFFIFPKIGFLESSIILASTVLIDVDHYLYYVYKKKDFSLTRARKWFFKNRDIYLGQIPAFQKENIYGGICFLHGIEFILLLAILSFFVNIFIFILIGFFFHQILDLIEMYSFSLYPHKIISFFYSINYTKHKKLPEEYILWQKKGNQKKQQRKKAR